MNEDEDLVHEVVMHAYASLRKWLANPMYKARINIPDLGSFALNLHGINKDIEKIIKLIRRCTDEEYKQYLIDYFKMLWNFRQLCISYTKTTSVDNWEDQSKRPREVAKLKLNKPNT